MKKEYIKPETEALKMETENLICTSPGLGGKAGGGGVLSKEREEMEDEIEMILW